MMGTRFLYACFWAVILVSGQNFIDITVVGPGSYKSAPNQYSIIKASEYNVTCCYNINGSASLYLENTPMKPCSLLLIDGDNLYQYSCLLTPSQGTKITCNVNYQKKETDNLSINVTAFVSILFIQKSKQCEVGLRDTNSVLVTKSYNISCDANINKKGSNNVVFSNQVTADICNNETGDTIAVVRPMIEDIHSGTQDLAKVIIRPKTFTTRRPITFVCNSEPAAPLHWSIFNNHGNLFDHVRNLTNLSVAINHNDGNSSLYIAEAGENAIKTVTCSTKWRIASAHLVVDSSFEHPNYSTDRQLSSTVEDIREDSDHNTATARELIHVQKSEYMWLATLALPVLIILVTFLLIFKYKKFPVAKQGPHHDAEGETYDVVPGETVFAKNPTYESYDDTEASSTMVAEKDLYSCIENLKSQPPPLPKLPASFKDKAANKNISIDEVNAQK